LSYEGTATRRKQLGLRIKPQVTQAVAHRRKPLLQQGKLDFSPAENRALQIGAFAAYASRLPCREAPGFLVLDSRPLRRQPLNRSSLAALKSRTSKRFGRQPAPDANAQAHRSRDPADATSLRNAPSLPRPLPTLRANPRACLPLKP